MSKQSFTPGPWWWDGTPGESNLRCGDPAEDESDGSVIRYAPYEGMWLSRYGSATEDAANARLIAFAPCLLAAAELALANLMRNLASEEACGQPFMGDDEHEAIAVLSAVIAKARGDA